MLKNYNPDAYLEALSAIVDMREPKLIIMGHSSQGIEIAPALAVERDLPIITDIIDLKVKRICVVPGL